MSKLKVYTMKFTYMNTLNMTIHLSDKSNFIFILKSASITDALAAIITDALFAWIEHGFWTVLFKFLAIIFVFQSLIFLQKSVPLKRLSRQIGTYIA